MASFGHSGSHTSQLIHSSVIISAISPSIILNPAAKDPIDKAMEEVSMHAGIKPGEQAVSDAG